MLVKTVMHRAPALCVPFDNANAIAKLMKRDGVDFMPVVENEPTHMFAGVVTERDLCVRVLAEGKDSARTPISDVMTRPGLCCRPGDTIEKAARIMREHQVHHLAVVGGDGCVIGVISIDDVTRERESKIRHDRNAHGRNSHSAAARRPAANHSDLCPFAFSALEASAQE